MIAAFQKTKVRKNTREMHAMRTILDTPLIRGERVGFVEGEGAKADMVLGRVKDVREDEQESSLYLNAHVASYTRLGLSPPSHLTK